MLRTDALASLYLFRPLRWGTSPEGRVPILMYHSVSGSRQENRHPYYQTVTTPEAFDCQMKLLRDNGYTVVSLHEAVTRIESSTRPAARTVVITFDDGFQDFYTNAFPILDKYGFSAAVFLPTAHVGEVARSFNGTECLTWSQVRELQSAGIEFGSHTVTHPELKNLNTDDLRYELRGSKETIEERLGCPVTSFAYPYAFPETDRSFRQKLRGILEESGYENGVSTILGTADRAGDRYFMKRLPVNTHDDSRLFRAKLDGAYDWLHKVQYASKLIASKL
jgi:peptidoglycan/xylan/chitin deacetylase (PgdA/CDA1 family)